jgi:hypothetical protein
MGKSEPYSVASVGSPPGLPLRSMTSFVFPSFVRSYMQPRIFARLIGILDRIAVLQVRM